MKTSHFKLADKMGYKSPLEESTLRKDWQEKRESVEENPFFATFVRAIAGHDA